MTRKTQRKKIEGTRHCCSSVSFPARWKTFGENWRIWSLLSVASCFPLNLSYWKIFAFDSQFSSTPWKTDRRRLMYSGVDDTSYYNIFTFIPRCIFVEIRIVFSIYFHVSFFAQNINWIHSKCCKIKKVATLFFINAHLPFINTWDCTEIYLGSFYFLSSSLHLGTANFYILQYHLLLSLLNPSRSGRTSATLRKFHCVRLKIKFETLGTSEIHSKLHYFGVFRQITIEVWSSFCARR